MARGPAARSPPHTDANGSTEHRGLPTKVDITNPGGRDVTVTGAYDANGTLTTQNLPGGITQRTSYDAAGEPTALTYSGDVTTTDDNGQSSTQPDQIWVGWSQDNDVMGRVRRDWTPSGSALEGDTPDGAGAGYSRQYTYDRAARLTGVTDKTATAPGTGTLPDPGDARTDGTGEVDRTATSCVQRTYAFDRNGNRTSKATSPAADDGSCGASGTNKSWSYDTADRITGGYTYDKAYGWLGGKQRATDGSGFLLMGARLYSPATASFTSKDAVFGGNSTAYSYPNDPINDSDLSGNENIFAKAKRHARTAAVCASLGRAYCKKVGTITIAASALFRSNTAKGNWVRHFAWIATMATTIGSRAARNIGKAHEYRLPKTGNSIERADSRRDSRNNATILRYVSHWPSTFRALRRGRSLVSYMRELGSLGRRLWTRGYGQRTPR